MVVRSFVPAAGLLVALLWSLAGCATASLQERPVGFIAQPPWEPPSDRLTNVTIRNGRGEVIVDQTPDPYRPTTVEPPAGTFDGTLVIEWESQAGHSATQTLEHDPDRSFKLDFDWGDREFTLTEKPQPPAGNRFSFRPFGGYMERSLGGTGAFTDITGGEKALVEVDRLDGFRVGAALDYRLFGPTRVGTPGLGFNADALDLSLGVEYTKLEGSDDRFVAPGTDETGITFPFGVGGSEGLDFALTGAAARLESRFEGASLRFGDRKRWVKDDEGGHWEYQIQPSVFFSYGRYSTDARIRNATFPDIFARDETDLDEWRLGVEFGARAQRYITPGIAPFIGGSVQIYHRWSDLEGVQQTTAPGTLTPAQQEPLKYSDDDSGIGARLGAELGVEMRFTDYFTAEVKGFTAYDTSTPFADKRDNPMDDGPGIDTDDRFDWGIVAGVAIGF